ncbi:LCP family protein [Blastococcus mobilis]|uniref:Transcriptional attenuator, LytR family n=1 Tax=Blastococcus mobilis TaxID=1938746 RepID=A0A238Y4Z2_9ACTN|nr:LCP family protein [Blastococcus mobilis]SNR65851.1 transcriptional attenuator, LytR family [Blastococcus mobilis]
MGEQPTRDADGSGVPRGVPERTRRGREAEQGAGAPVTVEQLLARQGSAVGRRRAARRVEHPALSAPDDVPPAVRNGLPPVPDGGAAARRAGLPPVPAAAQSTAQAGLPPVPVPARPPASWEPDSRPSRRSGPVPPLPGRFPPPEQADRDRPRRRRPAPERPPAGPGRRRLTRALLALGAVVGVVLLYHLGLYFYVDQKIDRIDALAVDGPEILAPALQAGDETYLVVGSGVPGQTGAASIATLLASVSAEGDRAVLVSFPPTALVDTPTCRTPDGSLRSPATEAFATSLLEGGPACMVRAVQQLSGLRIDHYLGVDLAGLPGMVDALGGVPVCVVPSQATAAAATPLPAGFSELTGAAAAGYLQPGDSGTDVTGTAVAERAQRLLTSTLRAAMSTSTLVDPLALNGFLNRAAEALTVDQQTTLGDLQGLAGSLGDLSGDAVQRASLPVAEVGYVPAGTDQAYVLLDGAGTRELFDAVIEGTAVPEEFTIGPEESTAPADETPAEDAPPAPEVAQPGVPGGGTALTVPPSSVEVDVLNGTGTAGLARTVADLMQEQGFTVGAVGNESGTVSESVVRYGPDVLEQARTVAAAVPGAVLQPSDAIGDTVQLVIGPGYSTVVPVTIGGPVVEDVPADTMVAPEASEPTPVSC